MEVDESLHYMQLPREVIVGKNVLGRVGEVCARLGFTGNALVVSGPITYPLAGEPVAKSVTKVFFLWRSLCRFRGGSGQFWFWLGPLEDFLESDSIYIRKEFLKV